MSIKCWTQGLFPAQVMRATIRIVCELLLTVAVLNQHSNQTDLFCFRLNKDSEVKCTWSPSINTLNTTEYFFHLEEGSNELFQVPTNLTLVTLERKILSAGKCYIARVKANNTELSSLEFFIEDIVKPNPPANVSAKPAPDDPTIIMIEWTKPTNLDSSVNFQFELQYRMAGQKNWTEVSHDEIEVQAISYCLEDLQPFTQYEFRVRCRRDGETNRKLWSNWSAVIRAKTLEASPDAVLDVWFMRRGLGSITLLWKPLEQHQARGIIRRYSVSEWDAEEMSKVTNITCCNISLSETTRHVTATAYNSVGATEPAKLNLVEDQSPVLNISTKYNNETQVCWEAPAKKMLEFVVEWSNMNLPEHPPEWKKIPALNECTTLRDGVLQPRIPYKISVYTRYQNGLGGPVSKIVYTEEGVPLTGPQVSIYNISQVSATLLWEDVSLSLRQGVILYYTLYYVKNPQEDTRQKVINISSALHNFMLLNLEPESTYNIWMTASTNRGEGKSGPQLKLKTQASHIAIGKRIVLVLFILAAIVLCIFFGKRCFYQRCSFLIPQWCCQRIPDPKIIRTRLQQNLITPDHFGMVENDPEVVKVEETIPEIVVQVPLVTSDSLTLTEANSSTTEDLFHPSMPTQDTDNSQQASIGLDKQLEEQPISTKLPGRNCFISGYEKHFMPSPEELLEDEWQLDRKEQWLGMVELQQ
ncbi:interleukin-12 receptor subunit beta-2-like isoform X1 [Pristis pectinata]|uniref:interleukin-12 receptor subunit beta-2-like isoform X1 n=1 Tax=Pristis pectinata TaxID=685728 RepID=UPI00223DA758|nr:interleukin-12 receptor subunit beta-2-like isoform X1 [Pristis pectinata]